jgi:threonine synthase
LIAKRIGLPTRHFVAATNVNDVVPEYLASGIYRPRPSVRTVANAMDVGAPSNFERMRALYDDDIDRMRMDVRGAAFEDRRVVEEIGRVYRDRGYLLDPHGAIAWLGLQQALAADPTATGWPIAGSTTSRNLALARPRHSVPLPASYPELVDLVLQTV